MPTAAVPQPPAQPPARRPAHPAAHPTPDDWALAISLIIVNFTVPGPVMKALERHYTPGDPTLSYPSVHVPLSGGPQGPGEGRRDRVAGDGVGVGGTAHSVCSAALPLW